MAENKEKPVKKKFNRNTSATWIVAVSGLIAAIAALISAVATLVMAFK